jgi:SAM-dependent methyltransferase
MHELLRAAYMVGDPDELLAAFRSSAEWREIRRLLPDPPAVVVELGSGRCVLASALAAAGYSVAGVEPCLGGDVGALAGQGLLASQVGAESVVVAAVAEALPVASGSIDVVIERQMMHHADSMDAVSLEVARVLRPGGRFLVLREHVVSSQRQLERFWRDHPFHALTGDEMAYPRSDYVAALTGAHLDVTTVLRPLSSQINLWPSEEKSVGHAILARLRVPTRIRSFPAAVLTRVLSSSGRLLDVLDRRPGRLYSFIAVKST